MLDDTTLDIVLATLDTITDFVEYLTRKEDLVRGDRAVMAAGEEDLLAFYLSDIDENEQHAFVVPQDVNAVFVDEGHWEHFSRHPQRLAKVEANDVSYAWDALIEQFNRHIIARTQYHTSHDSEVKR